MKVGPYIPLRTKHWEVRTGKMYGKGFYEILPTFSIELGYEYGFTLSFRWIIFIFVIQYYKESWLKRKI